MPKRQTTLDRSETKRQKTNDLGNWSKVDGCLIFKHKNQRESKKIASFDFDSTLTVTKSGKAFPTEPLDWNMWHDSVIPSMNTLYDEGYMLVVFTNQNGIEKKKITEDFIRTRFESFLEHINLPVDIYISTSQDHHRKPNTGMWKKLLLNLSSSEVDLQESFYCGDAAGRPKGWKSGKNKDFSCTDLLFARNVGLKFQTPEELFLKEPPYTNITLPGLSIDELKQKFQVQKSIDIEPILKDKGQEVILMVAMPASGKSTFCKKHLLPRGYVHVNRDTLKTKEKCMKVMENALSEGKSVVIDNTNPDQDSRKNFLNIAKKFNVPARCFHIHNVDMTLAHHLNMYREKITEGKTPHIPKLVYHKYNKSFQAPNVSEGFTEIVKIEFYPEFESKEEEEEFYKFVHPM